jgi:ABC-type uncharacterized transport system auxiliary subunit
MTPRRTLLLLPLALGACGSILPDRPNVPVRRYGLAPRRPSVGSPRRGAPVLLLRAVRAVPGLQDLGLRRARPDGSYDIAPYEEWIAPPAQLAEAALRSWLGASGLYSAVIAPGSRAEPSLVLEAQLTALEAAPPAGEARAALAGVLLREERLASRVLTPFDVSATVPLAQEAEAPAQAAAMEAALGQAFGRLEAVLAGAAR